MVIDNSNLIFLNDHRGAPESKGEKIDWDAFESNLSCAQMNIRSSDLEISKKKKIPIFATSVDRVTCWVNDIGKL